MNYGSMSRVFGRLWPLLVAGLAFFAFATPARALPCDPDYVGNFAVCIYPPMVTGSASSTQIQLTWAKYGTSTPSADYPYADALGIWRGGKKIFSTSNVNGVTQFTDLGLTAKTKYDYSICAYWTQFDDLHASFTHPDDPEAPINNSTPAWECVNVSYATTSGAPTPPKAPNVVAPQNLRASGGSYVAEGLHWDSPPTAGTNPAVSDTISWVKTGQATGAQSITRATFPGESVTTLITPLNPATSYTFTVCAVGKLGDRACANPLVLTTPVPPPAPMPAATVPTGIIAVRYGPQQVTVSWDKTNSDTFYRVERRVVATHPKKTSSDRGVYTGEWAVASPQLPKLPNAYNDSPPALNTGESLQYRVCGLFMTQPAAKCSQPVDVSVSTNQVLLNTGTAKTSAPQLHERLRSALQGKTGPKVSNPRRSGALENSSIMAVLRSQEQAAKSERQTVMSMHTADPGPIQAPAGNQPTGASGKRGVEPGPISKSASANSAISGNKSMSGTGASQTTLSNAGGGSGAPQQPMGTRSASGSQGSGGAAVNAVGCLPTIKTVNGSSQPTQTVFTPITTPTNSFNWYVIRGCGFGNKPGSAHLSGPFTGGQLKLLVDAWSWTDTSTILRIDSGLSGELDHDNVTLVLEPAGAAPIQKSGYKFYAARETVPLSEIPQSAVRFSENSNSSMSVQLSVPDGPTLEYTAPSLRPAGTASVFREWGTTIVPNGTDHFDLSRLAAGFTVDSVVVDMLDPHNPSKDCNGSNRDPGLRPLPFESRGIWGLDWPAGDKNFRVTWKVWLCRMSFMGPTDPDVWSDYAVNVSVRGPRGVDPWTGRRLLNLSPAMAPALH